MSIPQDVPVFRILDPAGFFGPDDHLYSEGDLVALLDEPNEQMEPVNDLAKKAMTAYLEKLDDAARAYAEKMGRPYNGRPRSFDEAVATLTADARRVQRVEGDGGIPLQGAKKRGRPRAHKVEIEQTPETTRKLAPLGRLSAVS